MMIKLAGFNVDVELLAQATCLPDIDEAIGDALTPETVSAAYARISRDPRPVDELRRAAIMDVAKARASNEQIVFGLGHASVAEHAVFNFDIMGVSRLAIEAVEHARLCSYTEKSQRYVKLGEEFVMPQEVVDAGLAEHFRALLFEQHMAYIEIFKAIRDHLLSKAPNATREEQKTIEGRAKEDARYVTSLAVEGQLGMTANARNLEHMIRRLLCHPLHEAKTIGALLYSEARKVAPSLLRYLEPTQEKLQAMLDLRELAREVGAPMKQAGWPENGDLPVRLLSWDEDADVKVMAALLHAHTGLDIDQCAQCVCCLEPEQEGRLIRAVFGPLQPWDALPRAFELADFQFELSVSASCFAQLKRHRMATLLPQGYDPFLGYTVPSSVLDAGMAGRFKEIMDTSAAMCGELKLRGFPSAAPYALTQAHRRRVIVKMNARELYHFSRLRQDRHAQWDIRAVADLMVAMAKDVCPLTMSLACGKDEFETQKTASLMEGA
jgi:flavin-dependent thymidylate synthase